MLFFVIQILDYFDVIFWMLLFQLRILRRRISVIVMYYFFFSHNEKKNYFLLQLIYLSKFTLLKD